MDKELISLPGSSTIDEMARDGILYNLNGNGKSLLLIEDDNKYNIGLNKAICTLEDPVSFSLLPNLVIKVSS